MQARGVLSSLVLVSLLCACKPAQPAPAATPPTSAATPVPAANEPVFMCPTDKDIRSHDSGKCPRSGMALVTSIPDPVEYHLELKLDHPFVVEGLIPDNVPVGASMQIVAALPDGHIEPLLWLYEYQDKYRHPFFYQGPLRPPAGTTVRGVRPPATIQLLGANK